jgi:lipoprotein-anchoring transpeptidase ErfK/SrfK
MVNRRPWVIVHFRNRNLSNMKSTASLTVYAPIENLPAEGYQSPDLSDQTPDRDALLRFFGEALADSDLVFDLAAGEAESSEIPIEFGKFTLGFSSPDGTPVPMMIPTDESVVLPLGTAVAMPDVSEILDPADLVRGFLDRLRPAIEASFGTTASRRTPLIRWTGDANGEGARVQLLGILEMPEDEFDSLLVGNAGFSPILEEAEVEAHGLRETAAVLAVLGLTALTTPDAEAGLLKNLFAKKGQSPAPAAQVQSAPKTQQARQGWVDVHKDAKIDKKMLETHDGSGTRIVVDVSRQRAFVLVDGKIAIDTPVSTARTGKYTPRGSYTITERVRSGKHSTIYGCEMPYWMRLNDTPIGLHIGDLPGYPASAGCVRLPYSVAPYIFDSARNGTQVKIVDSWDLVTNLWQETPASPMMVAAVSPPTLP